MSSPYNAATDTPPVNPLAGVISCDVTIDGQRVPTGLPGDNAADPTALSGLALTWGRGTTVDQPDPATLTLSLLDLPGDRSFMRLARLGAPVTVAASATVWPEPTVSIHHDPTYAGYPDGARLPIGLPAGAAAVAGSIRGRRGAVITPPLTDALTVTIPPAPPVPQGTRPDAWDGVPKTSAGEPWTVQMWVRLPLGAQAILRPVEFPGPYLAAARDAPARKSFPNMLIGDGTWKSLRVQLTAQHDDVWLGARLTVQPTGVPWDNAPWPSWDAVPDAITWDDLSLIGITDVGILAPVAGVTRTVQVFAGRITDATAQYSRDAGGVITSVTAQDFQADLANAYVGDNPWPAETAGARIRRILAAISSPVRLLADPRPEALRLSRTDVDRRSAGELLRQAAASTDAVLRAAVHPVTGPYLRLEDPAGRPALRMLQLGAGGLVEIAPVPITGDSATIIDAADVDLDPLTWQQSVADVCSRATIDWLDQTTTPNTTGRTVTVTSDRALRAVGERTVSLSSQLTTDTDAASIGSQLLARLDETMWRATGVVIDTGTAIDLGPDLTAQVVTLLDGTARIGRPVQITGIPEWTPSPAATTAGYIEGGTYSYIAGCWTLALNISAPNGLGASITWDQLDPTWTWDQFSPEITWDDLTGVGPTVY